MTQLRTLGRIWQLLTIPFLFATLLVYCSGCGGGGSESTGIEDGSDKGRRPPKKKKKDEEQENTSPWPTYVDQAPSGVGLPQDHDYQVTLRNYLGSFAESDFQVDLGTLTYNDSYVNSDDQLFRLSLALEDWIIHLPRPDAIRLDPAQFTLSSIEAHSQVNMDMSSARPVETAWWAQWNYAGNPYHNKFGVKARAFVAAAVDMIMLDALHESGSATRSDFLGASLIRHAYIYSFIKAELPANVRAAYEHGLMRMFTKLEVWGATGIHADMDTRALIGMAYVARCIDDPSVKARADEYAKSEVFGKFLNSAGYINHGGGFDATYNGISLQQLAWAAALTHSSQIASALESMSHLKSCLTFAEPKEEEVPFIKYYGPSHFTTSTDGGSAQDQSASYFRDVTIGMFTDKAKYLAWSGRLRSRPTTSPDLDGDQLREFCDKMVNKIPNSAAHWRSSMHLPLSDSMQEWKENHWIIKAPIYAYDYYVSGHYDSLRTLASESPELKMPPIERQGMFVEQMGDSFVVAKFEDFSTVVHCGDLSWWGSDQTIAGYSGGGLSAFWTVDGGSAVLGKARGFASPTKDVWSDWRLWPVHAISGENGSDQPFSSSRLRHPEREISTTSSSATITVGGSLSNTRTAPSSALTAGAVEYERKFVIDSSGVHVTSTVSSSGSDRVKSLYDMIPLFLADPIFNQQKRDNVAPQISFERSGQWVDGSTSLMANVTAVRIERYGKSVYVKFDSPVSAKLSPVEWVSNYQTRSTTRNVMIDMLGNGGSAVTLPASTSTSYKFVTSN